MAKICGSCKIEKPPTEFYGAKSICKPCAIASAAEWRKNNPEKMRAHRDNWVKNNPEKMRAARARWAKEHPVAVAAIKARSRKKRVVKTRLEMALWNAKNREKVIAHRKRDRVLHQGRCNAYSAKRKASKLRATPAWANPFFIREIYELAQLRTKITGFEWQVDHIVPLKSKLVCGLHVEDNLRVIPAVQNWAKNNKHWPDMPERRV